MFNEFLPMFTKHQILTCLFSSAEETIVHEFAALGLCNMATEFSSKAAIFESNGIEPLVKCLSSGDPDVQKNAIEAVAQMMLVSMDI